MSNITVTYRDGRVAQLEQVYIRGSKIRFLILPDMLKNAPMLKSMKNKNQGSGAGRGKAAILKAQGELGNVQPMTRCHHVLVCGLCCEQQISGVFFTTPRVHFLFRCLFKRAGVSTSSCFNIDVSVSAVAARGRGRGGIGRGNIFQKRR